MNAYYIKRQLNYLNVIVPADDCNFFSQEYTIRTHDLTKAKSLFEEIKSDKCIGKTDPYLLWVLQGKGFFKFQIGDPIGDPLEFEAKVIGLEIRVYKYSGMKYNNERIFINFLTRDGSEISVNVRGNEAAVKKIRKCT
jgi:hypothetical protein